jgi:hypothetical protein
MNPSITLRKALADPLLLGSTLAGDSWIAWRTLLIASMGEELDDQERALFKQLTGGREHEPNHLVEEFVGVIGRRGGKSRSISVLATYIAGLCEHPALVPGERGVLLIIAPDTSQADITLDYIEANFKGSPILNQLIESRVQRALRLTNHIDIEVRASDFRRLRGPTFIGCICDEVAFFLSSESSSNPDSEILASVRPGLATTNGPLFMISSPYARRGELWRLFNKHFGPAGDPLILVAQGASRTFNPSLPQSVVDRAMERDQASALAEFGAEFRRDIESFVSIEAVNACVCLNERERAPKPGLNYVAFADPSGGSNDSMTLAIGHFDSARDVVVVDALREAKPPFSPEQVVQEFSGLVKSYGVAKIMGDRYAGIWPVEQFGKFGITYEQAAKPKSDLYVSLLPLLNSARIDLLDHPRLINQLLGLERRSVRGGRDSIDHAPGGHDDICNSVAGLASIAISPYGNYDLQYRGFNDDDPSDPDGARAFRVQQLMQHIYRHR